eukprot:365803-Chlamydomonas_euryale.AAC.11
MASKSATLGWSKEAPPVYAAKQGAQVANMHQPSSTHPLRPQAALRSSPAGTAHTAPPSRGR